MCLTEHITREHFEFDVNEPSGLESLGYLQSFGFEDEDIIGDLSLTYNPRHLNLLPNPLDSDLTTLSPLKETSFRSPLTGEDAAHVENLVYWGVDSPVLPPDILATLAATIEKTPGLVPVLPGFSTIPITTYAAPCHTSSASIGFTPVYVDPPASPRAPKRGTPLEYPLDESQQYTPGPSASPRDKRAGTSYPGESSFQLDPTVPPLELSKSPDQLKGSPHIHPNYPLCRCQRGPTKRPARHWDNCPYNPEGRKRRFLCDICGRAFSTRWNKDRHVKSCLRRGS